MIKIIALLMGALLLIRSFFSDLHSVYFLFAGLCLVGIFIYFAYKEIRVECYVCKELVKKNSYKCKHCNTIYERSYNECYEDDESYRRRCGKAFLGPIRTFFYVFIGSMVINLFTVNILMIDALKSASEIGGLFVNYFNLNNSDKEIANFFLISSFGIAFIVGIYLSSNEKRYNSWDDLL